jgi:hypothetical protein
LTLKMIYDMLNELVLELGGLKWLWNVAMLGKLLQLRKLQQVNNLFNRLYGIFINYEWIGSQFFYACCQIWWYLVINNFILAYPRKLTLK